MSSGVFIQFVGKTCKWIKQWWGKHTFHAAQFELLYIRSQQQFLTATKVIVNAKNWYVIMNLKKIVIT